MRAEAKGTAAILASAAGYGLISILVKLALADGVRVFALAAWRFVLGAALVWAVVLVAQRPLPPRGAWPALLGIGVLYAVDALAYVVALQWIPATTAVLVFYLYPIVVVLLAAAFLGERLTARRTAATLLSVAGCGLTAGEALGGGHPLGIVLVLVAVAALSAFILISRGLTERLPAFSSAALSLTGTAGVLVLVALATGGLALGGTPRGATLVATLALVSTALPLTLFLFGLKRVGAGKAAVFSTVEPVVTVIAAGIVLDERIAPLQYVGGALILAGVLWLRSERPLPRSEEPAPFEAP